MIVADEIRSYPPTERRLGRLWAAGITPASPGLVAFGVLAAAWIGLTVMGPWLARWAQAVVRDGLVAAAEPDGAMMVARGLALRGLAMAAGVGVVMAAVALALQALQLPPRGASSATPGGAPTAPGGPQGGLSDAAGRWSRGALMVALAAVSVMVAVRAALIGAERIAAEGLDGAWGLARAIGWPMLGLLGAAAAFDLVARRASWFRAAWMSRSEMQQELRETEGHPLTRQRRRARRRRHA